MPVLAYFSLGSKTPNKVDLSCYCTAQGAKVSLAGIIAGAFFALKPWLCLLTFVFQSFPALNEMWGIEQGILKGEISLYHWPPVWFGISCMTTDNFCFYMQNRLIQTSQTGGNSTVILPPFSIPCSKVLRYCEVLNKILQYWMIINDNFVQFHDFARFHFYISWNLLAKFWTLSKFRYFKLILQKWRTKIKSQYRSYLFCINIKR